MKFIQAAGVAIAFMSFTAPLLPERAFAQTKKQDPRHKQEPVRQASPEVLKTFHQQIKDYVNLRQRLEDKLPKLSAESTPKEIEAHQEAFAKILQVERTAAKPGEIFKPEVAMHLRYIINYELTPAQRKEIKETLLHAQNKGVPLRINYPYPETKEMVDMLPTLLLKLPELPPSLRYRFVGRSLLLIDREPRLIIDYMPAALP